MGYFIENLIQPKKNTTFIEINSGENITNSIKCLFNVQEGLYPYKESLTDVVQVLINLMEQEYPVYGYPDQPLIRPCIPKKEALKGSRGSWCT